MKLRHYVPVAALRNVYFGIVYSYMQYGVTSWGNAASKYTTIQIQQNYNRLTNEGKNRLTDVSLSKSSSSLSLLQLKMFC